MNNEQVPTVSVVMGVYNAEQTVRAAIESVLSQTYGDFEFIVIDDGSTDSTGRILAEYAESDARVRVIKQANQGLTRSLITGTKLSRGRYVARQDADDISLPSRLQKQVAQLDANSDAVLATSWVEDVSPEGASCGTHKTLVHSIPLGNGQTHTLVGIPAHGSVMMRRDALKRVGGYRACFYYAQDSDLWLRLSGQGHFIVVPEVLYRRLVGTESISSRFRPAQTRYSELAVECYRAVRQCLCEAVFLKEAADLAVECQKTRDLASSPDEQATSLLLIAAQLGHSDSQLSKKYLWKAVKTYPWHWRSWKALLLHLIKQLLEMKSGSSDFKGNL
jgi:glycosyltransferase involved in cell wall biosynthesis